jgi:hypothetical protein
MNLVMTAHVQGSGDRSRLVGVGAALLATVVITNVVGLLLGPERRVDSGDMVFLSAYVVLTVVIWAVVLWAARPPDHDNRAAVSGLVLGILAVLTNVAFWTGLPLVLGVGGVLLGRRATTRAEHGAGRAGLARAARVCGWLAIALWAFGYFVLQDFFPALLDMLG